MSNPALQVDSVSKKFKKGQLLDSLRDSIPALCKRFIRGDKQKELTKRQFWALKDVSFEVHRGEVLGIIGHNGAGKSTMLKLLSGIMKPSTGRIAVNGSLSALIEVGAGFHPDLTGRENIYLNGAILGMKRAEIAKKLDQIVAFSGLEEFIDTPVKRYSTGMYARLGFSVAAHVDAEILLVDEVLSVGDYVFQNKCMQRMREVVKSGAAVIFVSHNLRAVVELCDRALLLNQGTVVNEGSPQEVVRDYLDPLQQHHALQKDADVYVSRVALRGKDGHQVRFQPGDEAWCDVEIRANRDCIELSLSLFLKDDNGHPVFDTSTERLGRLPFSLSAGETIELSIGLTLHLACGAFHLGTRVYRYAIQRMYDERFPCKTLFIDSENDVRGIANLYPQIAEDCRHSTAERQHGLLMRQP